MSKYTDAGKFNPAWLESQSTASLRYEARCERVRNWQYAQRHTLLANLIQLPVIPMDWAIL